MAEAAFALVALVVLVPNIQGAIAPLSSALGLLPLRSPDPVLADTIAQVRGSLESGARGPALEVLVHDFTVYHVAMAGLGVVVTFGLLAGAAALWARTRTYAAAQPGRRLLATVVAGVVLSSAFFGAVTAGNVSTVARPAPALLGFFEGSR